MMKIFNDKTNTAEQYHVKMLIPPPVLLVVVSISAMIIHWIKWGRFLFSMRHSLVGGGIFLAGILLIIICGRTFMKKHTPIRPDRMPTTVIVMNGPYAYSRNPMYIGMVLVLTGLMIAFKSPAFLLAIIVFLIIIHFGVVLREERYLISVYPQAYREYMRSVRRWI